MRDALGGSMALTIIVVFIVVALGYLAFNVNYMKAFRMKNKVIATYEEYKGNCGTQCQNEIVSYANEIGYTMGQMTCSDGNGIKNIYCVEEKIIPVDISHSSIVHTTGDGVETTDIKGKHYFKITTKINIELPVINKVFDFKAFEITGDTKAFEIK